MVDTLAAKTCTPCKGGIPPLTPQEAEHFHVHVPQGGARLRPGASNGPSDFATLPRRLRSFNKWACSPRPRSSPRYQLWLGLRHGGDANQKDQRAARKRFHHGGQDRPALGASRLTIDRSVSTTRKESDRAECERKLDQALELTFPGSDPIAVGARQARAQAIRPALSERVLPTRKHRNVKERQR